MRPGKIIFIGVSLLLFNVTIFYYWVVPNLDTELTDSHVKAKASSTLVSRITEENVEEEFNARIARVQTLCQKYHLGAYSYPNRSNDLHIKDSPTPQYSYFFVNKKHKLAWCPVYKAGSTSWLHNMMSLDGYTEEMISNPPKQLSIWAREIYGDGEPGNDFETAKKLLIVRHPFTRLISAYRDKLSNASVGLEHGTEHFYNNFGKKIVAKFRPKNSTLVQREPTFPEFVDYLLKTEFVYYDDHWLPVQYSCTPCRVNYDYIAKVETYQRDQKYIIQTEDLGEILKPKWKHKTRTKIQNNVDQAREYFSTLPKSQVLQLVQKYQMDFELFDYEFKDYLRFASGRPST